MLTLENAKIHGYKTPYARARGWLKSLIDLQQQPIWVIRIAKSVVFDSQ